MASFDALPASIRELLNYCPVRHDPQGYASLLEQGYDEDVLIKATLLKTADMIEHHRRSLGAE